jgi:hypothetical protein
LTSLARQPDARNPGCVKQSSLPLVGEIDFRDDQPDGPPTT